MNTLFYAYTLDALAILTDNTLSEECDRKRYLVDLSENSLIDSRKVLSCDLHDDNALFYQILSEIGSDSRRKDDYSLRDKIVFIDFKGLFEKYGKKLSNKGRCSEDDRDRFEEDSVPNSLADIFNPENGVDITFDGEKYVRFVPFDKSNSMARDYRITFISSEIKDQIDERLRLGIDFTKIPVNLSKYYSYRGLYLSTGYRIDHAGLKLNCRSVIVIPDAEERTHVEDAFTVKDKGADFYEFVHKPMDLPINAFDGEGLISPDLSEKINDCLVKQYGIKKKSRSFQIRLPFSKGMLHQVDFHRIVKEVFGQDPSNIYIEDVYGVKRCLGDAHIIMTKSMFKAKGWLEEYLNNENNEIDPMEYYFTNIAKYKHALYVTNLDSRLSNIGKVRLNHQFLSTLALERAEFEGLLKEYIDGIDGVSRLIGNSSSDDNDVDEKDDGNEEDMANILSKDRANINHILSEALKFNSGFLHDYKVRETIASIEKGLENNIAMAKIEAIGEQRFLSSDLFALIIHMLKKSTVSVDLKDFKRMCIKSGCFYMPSNTKELEPGHNYVFLRNPHLSRNEQCLLRYSNAREVLYKKYFSHLKGIVMVSYDSITPMALSGADFDGDIVKIIFDRRIISCVQRSCYTNSEKGFIRKNAVVVIEAPKAKDKIDNGSIPVETVIDTFSNDVGKISNMAVKYAELEYAAGADEAYRDKCAECTIVTGLEIDAAKTGKHPSENIAKLGDGVQRTKSVFLDFKEEYNKLTQNRFFEPKALIENGKGTLYLSKTNMKQIKDIPLYDLSYKGPVLSLIPGAYITYICNKNGKKIEQKDGILFRFEQEKQWKSMLDPVLKEEAKKLIESYSGVRKLERDIKSSRSRYGKSKFIGHILTLLDMKYDDHSYKLSEELNLGQAINLALIEIKNCFDNSNEIKEAIKRLTEKEWSFSTKDELRERLCSILGLSNEIQLGKTTESLLYDFRQKGYMLLYYMLQETRSRIAEEIEIDEWNDEKIKSNDCKYYIEMKRDLIRRDTEKQSSALCEKARRELCRGFLSELFNDDFDRALMYVYSCAADSKRSLFMWGVFDGDVILRNIQREGAKNA